MFAMSRTPHQPFALPLAVTLLGALAALGAAGCGPIEEDEPESAEAALTTNKKVITHRRTQLSGGTPVVERTVQLTCAKRCTASSGGRCIRTVDDCSKHDRIELHAKPSSTVPFPATAQGPYWGCGPQAAANMAGYVTGYAYNTTITYTVQ